MSMDSKDNDVTGRDYSQVTKDGSSSAASLGAGGTGDIGSMGSERQSGQRAQGGNAQQAARTDDLLSPGTDSEQREGFAPHEEAGELQTGLGGLGSLSTGNAGNRQSDDNELGQNQHNDWGHDQAGQAGQRRSDQRRSDQRQSDPRQSGQSGNIGGMPGSQHNDWGHSPVPTDDDATGAGGNHQSADKGLPRQGVMPGEEMGRLQRGQDDKRQS